MASWHCVFLSYRPLFAKVSFDADPGRSRRAVNGLPAPKTVLPVALTVTARLIRPAFVSAY